MSDPISQPVEGFGGDRLGAFAVARVSECPQCRARVVNTISMGGVWISARCETCGWSSDHRPRLYSPDEAQQEILDAARALLQIVHCSDEAVAVDAMWRSSSQRLREQAAAIDHRDVAIRRLTWAVARVDAASEERRWVDDRREPGGGYWVPAAASEEANEPPAYEDARVKAGSGAIRKDAPSGGSLASPPGEPPKQDLGGDPFGSRPSGGETA